MTNSVNLKEENKSLMVLDNITDLNQFVSISLNKKHILAGIEHQSLWFLEKNLEEVTNELITSVLEIVQSELERSNDLKSFLPSILEKRNKYTFNQILKAVSKPEIAEAEYQKLCDIRKIRPISLQDFITYEIDPLLTNEIDNPALKLI